MRLRLTDLMVFGDLVISRCDEHDLLGMKIRIDRKNKNVIIDMREQLEEVFEMFEEKLSRKVASPAKKGFVCGI